MATDRRQEEPAEAELACDLCNTLWPAEALDNGVCPDCLNDDE
jgi:hypothetical protein